MTKGRFSTTRAYTKTVSTSTRTVSIMAAERTANWEKQLQRNPHPDFKKVEASRPPYNSSDFRYTKTPNPNWKFGDGANHLYCTSSTNGTFKSNGTNGDKCVSPSEQKHIPINPYALNRPPTLNYKLLISAIVPRPIAFLSTRSADGKTTNLAPFSYFSVIGHDPPLFTIGFACPLESAKAKDSLRNLVETKVCVINIISEHWIEAANSTAVNAPYGVSEWDVAGVTPVYDCETVKVARVKEAVFAIEGRLESVREFESRSVPGKVTSTLAIVEGTRFWVREDAVNEEGSLVDINVSVLDPLWGRDVGEMLTSNRCCARLRDWVV